MKTTIFLINLLIISIFINAQSTGLTYKEVMKLPGAKYNSIVSPDMTTEELTEYHTDSSFVSAYPTKEARLQVIIDSVGKALADTINPLMRLDSAMKETAICQGIEEMTGIEQELKFRVGNFYRVFKWETDPTVFGSAFFIERFASNLTDDEFINRLNPEKYWIELVECDGRFCLVMGLDEDIYKAYPFMKDWIKTDSGYTNPLFIDNPLFNGSTTVIDSSETQAENLPDPIATVQGKCGGNISRSALLSSEGVKAISEENPEDTSFVVVRFTVSFMGNEGYCVSLFSSSDKFTQEQKEYLKTLPKRRKVYIEDIIVQGTDGIRRKLESICFRIVE